MSKGNREIDETSPGTKGVDEPIIKGDDIETIGEMTKKRAKKEHFESGAVEKKPRRAKRETNKKLADLLEKKNETLLKMERNLEETEQLLETKENKLLRLVAEFENYKKRTRREWELHLKKANAGLLGDILGVLDDFDRAFAVAEDVENHFQSGIRMIYTQLMDVLKRSGLSEIKAEGAVFNPQFHEAVGNVESSDVEVGSVLHVLQKGYVINGQLLRPAKVIVVKEKNTNEPTEERLENN